MTRTPFPLGITSLCMIYGDSITYFAIAVLLFLLPFYLLYICAITQCDTVLFNFIETKVCLLLCSFLWQTLAHYCLYRLSVNIIWCDNPYESHKCLLCYIFGILYTFEKFVIMNANRANRLYPLLSSSVSLQRSLRVSYYCTFVL